MAASARSQARRRHPILDREFIAKDAAGTSKKVDVWEFAVPEGVDLSAWAGASSGLLDDSDVGEISAAMHPGSVRFICWLVTCSSAALEVQPRVAMQLLRLPPIRRKAFR
jgi:hypothetical protein